MVISFSHSIFLEDILHNNNPSIPILNYILCFLEIPKITSISVTLRLVKENDAYFRFEFSEGRKLSVHKNKD
jgi:hypothetical protein